MKNLSAKAQLDSASEAGTPSMSTSTSSSSTISATRPMIRDKDGGTGSSPSSSPSPTSPPSSELRTQTAVGLIVLIFATSAALLILVYSTFPHLEPSEAEHVKFPRDIDDAQQLGLVLSRYKDRYFFQVLGGVFVTYLFLQTFAIPGSIFLSFVSGYLFSFPVALTVICFCSATGASFCYLLSYLLGRRLVNTYLPERAASWSETVQQHKDNMLSYIIFLRITPFLPNWFINITSPVIGVDLRPFWLGTLFGVAPPSFIIIQAGTTLQQLTSATDALTAQSMLLLAVFAVLSIAPVFFRNRHKLASFWAKTCGGSALPENPQPQHQRQGQEQQQQRQKEQTENEIRLSPLRESSPRPPVEEDNL